MKNRAGFCARRNPGTAPVHKHPTQRHSGVQLPRTPHTMHRLPVTHQVLRAWAQVMLSLSHPLFQDTVVKLSSSRAAASRLTEFHKATPGSLHTANFWPMVEIVVCRYHLPPAHREKINCKACCAVPAPQAPPTKLPGSGFLPTEQQPFVCPLDLWLHQTADRKCAESTRTSHRKFYFQGQTVL